MRIRLPAGSRREVAQVLRCGGSKPVTCQMMPRGAGGAYRRVGVDADLVVRLREGAPGSGAIGLPRVLPPVHTIGLALPASQLLG